MIAGRPYLGARKYQPMSVTGESCAGSLIAPEPDRSRSWGALDVGQRLLQANQPVVVTGESFAGSNRSGT